MGGGQRKGAGVDGCFLFPAAPRSHSYRPMMFESAPTTIRRTYSGMRQGQWLSPKYRGIVDHLKHRPRHSVYVTYACMYTQTLWHLHPEPTCPICPCRDAPRLPWVPVHVDNADSVHDSVALQRLQRDDGRAGHQIVEDPAVENLERTII